MKSLVGRTTLFLAREREVLLAFLSSRLALWAIAWLSVSAFAPGPNHPKYHSLLWDMLFRWDANWYARIIQLGYSYRPGVKSNVAFFPLLPLLAGALQKVTHMRLELAGFLVSNAALLGAALLLRRLAALDFPAPSRVPQRAVWLLLFCPMTFFHSALYTESLFLLLTLAMLLFARERRWLAVGVAGGLLTATRGNALLIMLPVLWEVWSARRSHSSVGGGRSPSDHSVWRLLLVPSGLVLYATYLHFRVGDALAFGHAQGAWERSIELPWAGIVNAMRFSVPYREFLLAAVFAAVVLCVICCWMRLRFSYQIYAVASVLFLLCSSILHGLPRMLSVIFPFYLAVAAVGERSEGAYLFTLAAGAAVMAICAALFVSGYLMI